MIGSESKVPFKSKNASWYYSNAFSSFFKSYAQAINKGYSRTGGLFEEPFHRIEVKNSAQLTRLIYYIHSNPQKHGFVNDFREYPHSSYWSHLQQKPTKLQRKDVLNCFGDSDNYKKYHTVSNSESHIHDLIIEFD